MAETTGEVWKGNGQFSFPSTSQSSGESEKHQTALEHYRLELIIVNPQTPWEDGATPTTEG